MLIIYWYICVLHSREANHLDLIYCSVSVHPDGYMKSWGALLNQINFNRKLFFCRFQQYLHKHISSTIWYLLHKLHVIQFLFELFESAWFKCVKKYIFKKIYRNWKELSVTFPCFLSCTLAVRIIKCDFWKCDCFSFAVVRQFYMNDIKLFEVKLKNN